MGQTTAFALPYPEPADTPDVPRDIKALAEATDARLGGVGSAVSVFLARATEDLLLPYNQRHAMVPGASVTFEVVQEGSVYVAQAAPMLRSAGAGAYAALVGLSLDGVESSVYALAGLGSQLWSGSLSPGTHTLSLFGWVADPDLDYAGDARLLYPHTSLLVTLCGSSARTFITPPMEVQRDLAEVLAS